MTLRLATPPPAVAIERWINRRAHAGDVIERWSLVHEGKTILTFEGELEAHRTAKAMGWIVVGTEDLGEIRP